jgi:hypothetical protein
VFRILFEIIHNSGSRRLPEVICLASSTCRKKVISLNTLST